MAVKNKTPNITATGRRWFFGTNVTLVIVLLALIVGFVNYVGHQHKFRRDVAGGFASHRVSDRTATIIEQIGQDKPDQTLRVTTVYTSDDPESDRKKYLPRLRDFCTEMENLDGRIEVEHLHTGDQRAALRQRVQEKFATASKDYNDVVTQAGAIWDELKTSLPALRQEIVGLIRNEAWVSGFPPLAKVASDLGKHIQAMEETRREVEDLVHGEGIPRFEEANGKINTLHDAITQDLEEAQARMTEWSSLVEVLSDSDSAFAVETRSEANGLIALGARLKQIIGSPRDESVPENPKEIMRQFAKASGALAAALTDEVARVNTFVKQNPAIAQHPDWVVEVVQQQIFRTRVSLPWLLNNAAETLVTTREQVRHILTSDQPDDILKNNIRALRKVAASQIKYLNIWAERVVKFLADGPTIDETSRRRRIQIRYNGEHGITPRSVQKVIQDMIDLNRKAAERVVSVVKEPAVSYSSSPDLRIADLEKEMLYAAEQLDFERAAELRDEIESMRSGLKSVKAEAVEGPSVKGKTRKVASRLRTRRVVKGRKNRR